MNKTKDMTIEYRATGTVKCENGHIGSMMMPEWGQPCLCPICLTPVEFITKITN